MELTEVKEKAKALREAIQDELKKFRQETGYTPQVSVETKERKTNDGDFVTQQVSITLTIS